MINSERNLLISIGVGSLFVTEEWDETETEGVVSEEEFGSLFATEGSFLSEEDMNLPRQLIGV